MVTGVITQNVDLLHTKAGSRSDQPARHLRPGDLPGLRAHDDAHALAEPAGGGQPGFSTRRRSALAVAPDADAVVADTSSFRISIVRRARGMLKPDIVYFGENVPKDLCRKLIHLSTMPRRCWSPARRLRCSPATGSCAMRRRSAFRSPSSTAAVPAATTLATVKVDAGCSPILTLMADELVDRNYTCGDARTPWRTAPRMFAITRCSNAS